jgi:hypothetical protein
MLKSSLSVSTRQRGSTPAEQLSDLCFGIAPAAFYPTRSSRVLAGYLYLQNLVPMIQGHEAALKDFTPSFAESDLGWSHSEYMGSFFALMSDTGCAVALDPLASIQKLLAPNLSKTVSLIYREYALANTGLLISQIPAATEIRTRLQASVAAALATLEDAKNSMTSSTVQ